MSIVLLLLATAGFMTSGSAGLPAAAVSQRSLIQALEEYGADPGAAVATKILQTKELRAHLGGYRTAVQGWMVSGRGEEGRRRQLLGIALAMELAAAGVNGTLGDYNDTKALIEWACTALRQLPTSEFERAVHLASMAVLQGAGDYETFGNVDDPAKREGHLYHAMRRFPDDDRLRLARVLARLETRVISTRPVGPLHLMAGPSWRTPAEVVEQLSETFRQLTDLSGPLVRDESRLRRGVLRFLIGQDVDAVQDLSVAATAADPFVAYVANLVLGAVYDRTGDVSAAVSRYARAAKIVPATSARLALAAALFRQGQPQDAAEVTESWRTAPRVEDPWRIYDLGLYHALPEYLALMRRSLP